MVHANSLVNSDSHLDDLDTCMSIKKSDGGTNVG